MNATEKKLRNALKSMVDEFEGCYADAEPAMIAARAALASTESQDTESAPYGYSYECVQPGTEGKIWCEFMHRDKPSAGDGVRNITPLYTHPATSQSADHVRYAALREAAEVCGAIYQDHRDQYKGRGKWATQDNPRRADSHADGASDGASECEDEILALIGAAPSIAASESADMLEAYRLRGHNEGIAAALSACEDVIDELVRECDSAVESGALSVKARLMTLATSSAAKGATPDE